MRPEDIITANKRALKPGQKFRFHCDQCGDCCRNREDILLTPFDLFRIAGQLGITPGEVVKNYCEVYVGSSSHFPVVRLLPVGKDKACPFLKENRCSIHASKPAVCALFPLGRAMQYGALQRPEDIGMSFEFIRLAASWQSTYALPPLRLRAGGSSAARIPKESRGLVASSTAPKSLILPSAVGEADRQSKGLPLCQRQWSDCNYPLNRAYGAEGGF